VFNGVIERYGENPIRIKVGELVRIFFVNAGPNRPSSFSRGRHTVELGLSQAAILREGGDYPFVDHAIARAYKGAIGIFRATP